MNSHGWLFFGFPNGFALFGLSLAVRLALSPTLGDTVDCFEILQVNGWLFGWFGLCKALSYVAFINLKFLSQNLIVGFSFSSLAWMYFCLDVGLID